MQEMMNFTRGERLCKKRKKKLEKFAKKFAGYTLPIECLTSVHFVYTKRMFAKRPEFALILTYKDFVCSYRIDCKKEVKKGIYNFKERIEK